MKNKNLYFYGISSCLMLSATQAQAKVKEKDNVKPNVLFIIMDDMCDWANYLGGNNQVITPNLDRLAARGVSFSNAYTAVPLSNPSRTALLTGRQPFETGIYNNQNEISSFPVANNSLFMPQHFKNNGYTTIMSGKIFHTKPSSNILNNMWDDMTNMDGGYGPFIKNQSLPKEVQEKWRNYEMWSGPDTDFPDVRNSQKIIDYLGQSHDKPFFAAMGFYRPHNPYTAPKRYFDLYDLDKIKLPETLPNDLDDIPAYAINNFIKDRSKTALLNATGNAAQQLVRAYLACVSFADDRIGMILDKLDASPYADNTYIVLIGDNGFHHGEKERWGKTALWREANHVPFIIVPPRSLSSIQPGIECKRTVNLIDLYPTLTELCGLPSAGEQLAGNNLVPLLHNVNTEWNQPTISTFLPGNFAVRLNQWNYIRYANGSHELYNIEIDENEYHNLADKPEYTYMVDSLERFLPTTWYTGPVEEVVQFISEDISTTAWEAEFLRLNPSYVRPAIGSAFSNINNTERYFDKYLMKGALVSTTRTPNCVLPGITHGDATSVLAFRLLNDSSGYFEFPPVNNIGTLTLHVRSGAASADSYLSVQKYDEEDWLTLNYIKVRKQNDYNGTSIDEVITWPLDINEEVKLRIRGGNKFIQLLMVETAPFGISGTNNITLNKNIFKLNNRILTVSKPTTVSLFNSVGVLVYKRYVENHIIIPENLGFGFFLAKSNEGAQKILL